VLTFIIYLLAEIDESARIYPAPEAGINLSSFTCIYNQWFLLCLDIWHYFCLGKRVQHNKQKLHWQYINHLNKFPLCVFSQKVILPTKQKEIFMLQSTKHCIYI